MNENSAAIEEVILSGDVEAVAEPETDNSVLPVLKPEEEAQTKSLPEPKKKDKKRSSKAKKTNNGWKKWTIETKKEVQGLVNKAAKKAKRTNKIWVDAALEKAANEALFPSEVAPDATNKEVLDSIRALATAQAAKIEALQEEVKAVYSVLGEIKTAAQSDEVPEKPFFKRLFK